jgi:phage-related protein
MTLARFVGDSLEAIRDFPFLARKRAGYQIQRLQDGEKPEDWKPMRVVGPGGGEIRVRDDSGAYRVIYVAKFEEAVYVLHAFRKKVAGDFETGFGFGSEALCGNREVET